FKTFKQRKNITDKFTLIILVILGAQMIVNLIGVLGPEISFDALWYHLTLPKMYLLSGSISHIPGGLLYYSDMPKLGEMLYALPLSFGSQTGAKLIHFSFGLLSLAALYFLSRKFLSSKISLLVALIFYSNLVVGWESITAYVDLARTFFEIMALWAFINWWEKEDRKWLVESAVMLGLAITVKLIAISSLIIFSLLILLYFIQKKKKMKSFVGDVSLYWFFSFLIPLPWFVFSFMNTGNPFYPFFTNIYKTSIEVGFMNPLKFFSDSWNLLVRSQDPISPLYIIFLPIIVFLYPKLKNQIKTILFYSIIASIMWYLIPRTGGGRFILPYLPAFSLLTGWVILEITKIKGEGWRKLSFSLVIFISLISLFYRGAANHKYLPIIFGKEGKSEFLAKNLNFSFGDFYDVDSYFEKHIKKTDKVLLYGFHNLYYINFPFVDSSWVKKGDKFNFVAVQNSNLPERFSYWNLVYYNSKTNIKLYSLGGQQWVY
ncbi:MAG: glycosyltransferase family 39 protein, partial [Candidatus Levybacteria bacterium]|nr:glycosyltransferase family 39 protein [Candidatus Levybacteria bacterium]